MGVQINDQCFLILKDVRKIKAQQLHGGTGKSMKSLTQGKWILGQDSNPRPGRIQSRNTNRSKYDVV
jgi:hypothetical protein